MKHAYFRGAAVTAVGFLGATVLAIAPAQATSPYTSNTFDKTGDPTACSGFSQTGSSGVTSAPAETTITANAAAQSTSWSGSTTQADTATPTPNTLTQTYSASGTAQSRYSGSTPTSLQLTFKSSYKVTTTGAPHCTLSPDFGVSNNFSFTTARPLIATLSFSKTGTSAALAIIQSTTGLNSQGAGLIGINVAARGSETAYLPAGSYTGTLQGAVNPVSFDASTVPSSGTTYTGSGSIKMTFAVPGSASSGPSGKASTYVTMGHSLSCSSHSLRTTVTKNSTYSSKISKVVYSVNGHVKKTVYAKSIKPGLAISVGSLSATATNKIGVTVYLKNGTHVSEAATYVPCSV
ncbi:MAG: hypothetical protein ACTHJM_05625 [Marmoricola sp.]